MIGSERDLTVYRYNIQNILFNNFSVRILESNWESIGVGCEMEELGNEKRSIQRELEVLGGERKKRKGGRYKVLYEI